MSRGKLEWREGEGGVGKLGGGKSSWRGCGGGCSKLGSR